MFWLLFFIATAIALSYARARMLTVAAVGGAALLFFGLFGEAPLLFFPLLIAWVAIMLPLNIEALRQEWFTRAAMNEARRRLPKLSAADRIELASGGIGWEAELLSGQPDWSRIQSIPPVRLSEDELDFLRGPVDTLCRLCEASPAQGGTLSDEAWTFMRRQRFFGLRIPQRYGGRSLSATALSAVLTRIASSPGGATAATIVAAPSVFGLAEVLLALGTEDQKTDWLPQLADGSTIGCIAIETGSPTRVATARVCRDGDQALTLLIDAHYENVPLAPVAGLFGLAVHIADPDQLLGGDAAPGVGIVLLDTGSAGLDVGRRTLSIAPGLPSGPIVAQALRLPFERLVGGVAALARGAAVIAEGRIASRALTQPSIATGNALFAVLVASAQLRLRASHGKPLAERESVQETLAAAAAQAYAADALRSAAAQALDRGTLSGVAAAVVKTQCSALGAEVVAGTLALSGARGAVDDSQDSILTRWRALPLAARDGADLLLRAQRIFGPGVLRVHPYWSREIEAASDPVASRALESFDALLWPHVGLLAANAARSMLWGASGGAFALAPIGRARRNRQRISRYCASLALIVDASLFRLGGTIRDHEGLALRLGDGLAALCRAEAAIRKWEEDERPADDWALVDWVCAQAYADAEAALAAAIRRIPSRPLRWALRIHVFPVGPSARGPAPRQAAAITAVLMAPGSTRQRFASTCFAPRAGSSPLGNLERTLQAWLLAEPLQRRLDTGLPASEVPMTPAQRVAAGVAAGVLNADEADTLRAAQLARDAVLAGRNED